MIHVYSGPTIPAAEVTGICPQAMHHPPIRHGDLITLAPARDDVVVIIDGLFHGTAPIRHKEILAVLADGVTVVGASSMGALRAAELHPYGMHGIGEIYRAYRDGRITADDAVTVQHTPDGHPLGEPLVNLLHTLATASEAGTISAADADRLGDLARSLHYTRRSWTAVRRAAQHDPRLVAAVDTVTDRHACRSRSTDLKHRDAVAALRATAGPLPALDTNAWANTRWRTSFLRHWTTAFTVRDIAGASVPFRAELQHQQLYDPGFPGRWRARVLAWITSLPAGAAGTEAAALRTAAGRGITLDTLTRDQAGYWITPAETERCDDHEQLLRLLVRSARVDAATLVWPSTREEAVGLLSPRIDSGQHTAEAWLLNGTIARSGPGRHVHLLDPEQLRAHLAETWRAPDDPRELDAAARDRAFPSMDAAVEAARPFYLRAIGARRFLPVPAAAT
ncbi:TfuA-like protein [Streptomyces mirabilis]|uniref:TfuA-like protein n=1 Tax=Streptomyces mirabilis TaxID=68239 RepID=UPI0036A466A8